MKRHDVAQRSVDWMILRAGIPTASEFDSLITPNFEPRKGEMPKTYLHKKLAERWMGGPLASFNTFDMDQGNILEESAIPFYEFEYGAKIDRVGFCTTDDGRVGCSPDGLLGEDSGIEIKCPRVETHVGYLLNGNLPKEYVAQVHGSMWVTGRPEWKFMSFSRGLPPLLITAVRDEQAMKILGDVLETFLAGLDAGWERLCDINGGPPERKPLTDMAAVFAQAHTEDLIP